MGIRFIANHPAAFITEEKALIVAELHLGIEYELFKKGITVPSQRESFEKTIDELILLTGAKKLILLGDIKHKVPGMSIREEREIPQFLEHLNERIKTIIVKGNHDDRIENIVPKGIKIYGSHGFKLGRYGFFHGQAWPSKALIQCDYLFTAHIHPMLEFKDKFGYRNTEQIWIKGILNKEKVKKKYKIEKTGMLRTIILPVFNKFLGGVAVNKILEKEMIGPIMANSFFDIKESKIYLLDGTFLGTFKQLKI